MNITAGKIFKINSDEEKLTTKDYRSLIYESVKEDRQISKFNNISNSIKMTPSTMRTTSPKYISPDYKPTGIAARQSPNLHNFPNSPSNQAKPRKA
jgi:hypothetical protein